MESSGKFAGQGSANLEELLTADYSFNGAVSTTGSTVRVSMTMKMKGSGDVDGTNFTFSASATEHLTATQQPSN